MVLALATLNGCIADKDGWKRAPIGQVVSAEKNNGCIDNKANCVFVGGAIGVGACQGGEVIWVPGVYGTCLRVSDVDYEPSFRRMPQT